MSRSVFFVALLIFIHSTCANVFPHLGEDHNPPHDLPPFGRAMRSQFHFDPSFINLNHASFGTYPKHVQTVFRNFQARSEWRPDLWMLRDAKVEQDKVKVELAKLMHTKAKDLVMMHSTTGGINSILRSFIFKKGDQILYFSTIYESMFRILEYIKDRHQGNVSLVQFNVTYPISNQQLLINLEAFLNETDRSNEGTGQRIALAYVDHITSKPQVILPLKEILDILHRRNILGVVDAANAIGQIDIDLEYLKPDYYVTNCHKWLYAARGCTVLYVDEKLQSSVHPNNIGWNYAVPGNFQKEFFQTGTTDYSAYMTVIPALEFRRWVGGEKAIQKYTHDLALAGGKLAATRLGTQDKFLAEESQVGSVIDVRLPINNPRDPRLNRDFWIDTLVRRFDVYSSIHFHGDGWYARLAAQIYNDLTDFEEAAKTFLTICEEMNNDKWDNLGINATRSR